MEEPFSKEDIVNDIIEKVEDLGFCIEKNRVFSFVSNFQEKYDRLPSDHEIKPIVLSYMKICKEEEENIISTDEIYDVDDLNYGVFDKEIYNVVKSNASPDLNQFHIQYGEILTISKTLKIRSRDSGF